MDDHLSWTSVTSRLTRPTRKHDGSPYRSLFGLAPDGVYMAFPVTKEAVSSYLAFATLPVYTGGIFLLHFPGSRLHWTLSSILPYGARTFLTGSLSALALRDRLENSYMCTEYYTPISYKMSMLHLLSKIQKMQHSLYIISIIRKLRR